MRKARIGALVLLAASTVSAITAGSWLYTESGSIWWWENVTARSALSAAQLDAVRSCSDPGWAGAVKVLLQGVTTSCEPDWLGGLLVRHWSEPHRASWIRSLARGERGETGRRDAVMAMVVAAEAEPRMSLFLRSHADETLRDLLSVTLGADAARFSWLDPAFRAELRWRYVAMGADEPSPELCLEAPWPVWQGAERGLVECSALEMPTEPVLVRPETWLLYGDAEEVAAEATRWLDEMAVWSDGDAALLLDAVSWGDATAAPHPASAFLGGSTPWMTAFAAMAVSEDVVVTADAAGPVLWAGARWRRPPGCPQPDPDEPWPRDAVLAQALAEMAAFEARRGSQQRANLLAWWAYEVDPVGIPILPTAAEPASIFVSAAPQVVGADRARARWADRLVACGWPTGPCPGGCEGS